MITIGENPTWKVLKNNQLTTVQSYVWCKSEETANAVAKRFKDAPGSVKKYNWQDDAPVAGKDHWCVTQNLPWVIARTNEVRHGQWYIGVWTSLPDTREILLDIVRGRDTVDDYRAGVGPIQDPGYVIVAAHDVENPQETWCYRSQIQPGECFEYLNEPDKYLAAAEMKHVPDLPLDWQISTQRTATEMGRWNTKVKRIPRWDVKRAKPEKTEPVILPCVDPLDRLMRTKAEGLTGAQCLSKLEEAMRTEGVRRMNNDEKDATPRFMTLGADGLSMDQFELAQKCWAAKLATRVADAREAERTRVVLDYYQEE